MSDEELRELERLAAAGDPAARERVHLLRTRAGLAAASIVLEDLGEAVTEAYFVEWCVNAGDAVREGDPVVVLETDKVSVELPAPADGVVIAHDVPAGEMVRVGATLGQLAPLPPPDAALEARHDALVAAIVSAPEDGAARLAYAAFLEQVAAGGGLVRRWGRGTLSLRAEAARLHERLRQGPDEAAARRLAELAPRVERTARELLGIDRPNSLVEGGFVSGLDGSADVVAASWPRLVERAPLTALGVHGLRDAARLLRLPRLEQVRRLALGPHVPAEALEALARSGRLRPRRLVLRRVQPVAALAALGALELALHDLEPPAWLEGSSVERVELHLHLIEAEALRELAAAVPASVRAVSARVQVGDLTLPDDAARELIGARWAPPPPAGSW